VVVMAHEEDWVVAMIHDEVQQVTEGHALARLIDVLQ